MVVCGCGESLKEFAHPERFITIGVNDIGQLFQPNYLLVPNQKHEYEGNRYRYIEASQAEYIFTYIKNTGLPHRNVVIYGLGEMDGTDFSNPNVLHYSYTSAYASLCLAVHVGARRIGLMGVDFTNNFSGTSGVSKWGPYLQLINDRFRRLGEVLKAYGIAVFNLSGTSRLTAFPRMPLEEFAGLSTSNAQTSTKNTPLRIVSYATTPIAGGPAVLARCINGGTPHSCRCIWGSSSYANGVTFEGDLNWTESRVEAEAVLSQADVVIVHNGYVESRHQPLMAGKAIVTMAHNYIARVDTSFVQQGFPGVVVGQYQATLPEFKEWSVVPIPIPLWERAYQPGEKGEYVTICYTPANKHQVYPSHHPMYWHSKAYTATMHIIEKLSRQFSLRLEVVHERQLPHSEALELKRRAHIVIDECVTGSYHTNSLEGLATGCVVVNGVGLLPGVTEALHYCTGGETSNPFVFASLEVLEGVLTSLIERGVDSLFEEGIGNRQWMEKHWSFAWQWRRFWEPVIVQALRYANRPEANHLALARLE